MLKSRLVSFFAYRTRLAMALGTVVAAAVITIPAAAGAATGATAGAAPSGAVTAGPAAPFPATVVSFHCWSLVNCIAVGANTPQMANQLIAERWNGIRWTRSAMPKPAGADEVTISGLACPSRVECVAVGEGNPARGNSFPIAEYWNGSRWTAGRAAAAGSGDLDAVACSSARNCYAVGNFSPNGTTSPPLIEHWNGARWFTQVAPIPRGTSFGVLLAVSCPSAKFCVAVGTDGAGKLIERFAGNGWYIPAMPRSAPSALLASVSCPSASSCFAVGSNFTASGGSLVVRWNGKTWSQSSTPVPHGASDPGLQSVSCVSAVRCLAVGDDMNPSVYADSWNGRGWHLVAMTITGGHLGDLSDVSCLAATSCVALGGTTQFADSERSESVFWNGTRWKVVLTA